jgi:DNA-binding MarR family transcriptional regulator
MDHAMKSWTYGELRELVRLAKSGEVLNKDIAARFGVKPAAVSYKLKRLGIKNTAIQKIYGKWNAKHAHLREKVMTYFLTHTWDETAKKFGLTKSELKSLFTVAYRDPKLARLRKDTRNHAEWTTDDYLFAVRRSGVLPREYIGRKLGRGGARVIKERFKKFNSATKYMNGMPLTWATELWGAGAVHGLDLKTLAGPYSSKSDFRFRIIPWTTCLEVSKSNRTAPNVRKMIRAMAKFQLWIHDVGDRKWITRKLRGILDEQRDSKKGRSRTIQHKDNRRKA